METLSIIVVAIVVIVGLVLAGLKLYSHIKLNKF